MFKDATPTSRLVLLFSFAVQTHRRGVAYARVTLPTASPADMSDGFVLIFQLNFQRCKQFSMTTEPAGLYRINKSSQQTAYVCQEEYGLDPESIKIIRIWTPDPNSGFLPKFNAYFLVQGYISDKIFMKIRSLSAEI